MDYTNSNSYTTDGGTAQRMHLQAQATPTAVSDTDLNGLTWEALAVIKAAGLVPAAFDKTMPGTYTQLRDAIAILQRQQTNTAFTTTGVAPNFVLTPSLPVTAYAANQRFRVNFNVAGSGANAINVSALGTKLLKQYDGTGAKVAAVIAAGQLADIEYDGVDFVILDPLPASAVTTAGDATFVDSSAKPASTGWIRGAMSNIAAAAGFAISLASNGYIKFPSWLGGLVIQWGTGNTGAGSSASITLPLAFQTGGYAVIGSNATSSTSGITVFTGGLSATGFSIASSVPSISVQWCAFGR